MEEDNTSNKDKTRVQIPPGPPVPLPSWRVADVLLF